MSKSTSAERQVVNLLYASFAAATGGTYLTRHEYPITATFGGRTIQALAYRKVSNGNLYLRVLSSDETGPVFEHYCASYSSGLKNTSTTILNARTAEVRAQLIAQYHERFSQKKKGPQDLMARTAGIEDEHIQFPGASS